MNKTIIKAEVVADSLSLEKDRLTSIKVTVPYISINAILEHCRELSITYTESINLPLKDIIEAVQNDPFIPIAWQKPHSGMQETEYLTGYEHDISIKDWLNARDSAVSWAKDLYKHGVTKQLANRLLEPFMWTTMLITGSKEGWDNFFRLRCPAYETFDGLLFKSKKDFVEHNQDKGISEWSTKDYTDLEWLEINKGQAEIHMMALAEAIYDAMNESTPEQLKAGEWHIPYKGIINDKEQLRSIQLKINPLKEGIYTIGEGSFIAHTGRGGMLNYFNAIQSELGIDPFESIKVMISTAMAARESYTVVGNEKDIDYKKQIELHDRLIVQDPPHSSPLEHCNRAMTDEEYESFIKGNIDIGFDIPKEAQGWCNNIKGFIPYRYMIDNNLKM